MQKVGPRSKLRFPAPWAKCPHLPGVAVGTVDLLCLASQAGASQLHPPLARRHLQSPPTSLLLEVGAADPSPHMHRNHATASKKI